MTSVKDAPMELKITVVTVCYNAAETIERTMLSVLNQTYPNIEYIIIDGGSTDGTVDIIKKYADRLAYWVSEPDKGIYDAMNKGILAATGDYIFFLGADDKLINGSLDKILALKNDNKSIIYGNVITYPNGQRYGGYFSKFTIARKNICHQCMLIPSFILKENLFNCDYSVLADYVFNLQNFCKYKYKHVDIDVSIYNTTGISNCVRDYKFFEDYDSLIRNNLGLSVYLINKIRLLLRDVLKSIHLK